MPGRVSNALDVAPRVDETNGIEPQNQILTSHGEFSVTQSPKFEL